MAKFQTLTFALLLATLLPVLNFHLAVGKSLDRHESERATFADDNPKFSFDDVFNSDFGYNSFNPRWVSGNEYIYSTPSRDVYLYNIATGSNTTLMDGSIYTDNEASGYYVSADQLYITLRTNYSKGWRHSYNASYLIYDVDNENLVTTNPLPNDIQYITWAPQGNALAYVYGFDIYYRSSATGSDIRITNTGRANFVYNGIPDWVYEEEMISSNNVMYFSPDGAMLAYAQFNDTPCDHIKFIRYEGKQYPTVIDVSYPKAGTNQPTNKVFVYDLTARTETEVQPATSLTNNGDYLFNRVVWANDSRMAVLWCDRAQTWSSMKIFDYDSTGPSWNSVSTDFEHNVTGGWLHQRRPYWIPVFGNNADEYFTVRPNGNWQQVALVNGAGDATFVTQGTFTVTSQSASYPSLYHYDQTNDYIYFLATFEGPGKRQIYRHKGHDTAPLLQCVSCTFASQYQGRCDYVLASFSTDGSRVVISCRGEGVPLYALCSVNGAATSDPDILQGCEIVENNDDLLDKVASTSMSNVTHGTMMSSTGYEFHYEMWTPPGFDNSNTYPLLIDVYAGPGYQNVDYLWTRSWAPRYVPVNLNAIVVRVDGRGSNFYGDTFMHEVYMELGQKEIKDQIEAARYFGAMPYVDASKIAIWGWSYGGFATSHAIGSSGGDIKCGIAVAPLTDWKLYDTIYAERYMGTPALNQEMYNKANVMMKASNFSDSSFYLIHGMADDNVHFQNAANLEKALVNADVSFKNFFYADQDHSINVGNARRHVYKIVTRQLCQCFDIDVPSDIWG